MVDSRRDVATVSATGEMGRWVPVIRGIDVRLALGYQGNQQGGDMPLNTPLISYLNGDVLT